MSSEKVPNKIVLCKCYFVCLAYIKKDIWKSPTLVRGAFWIEVPMFSHIYAEII